LGLGDTLGREDVVLGDGGVAPAVLGSNSNTTSPTPKPRQRFRELYIRSALSTSLWILKLTLASSQCCDLLGGSWRL